MNESVPKVKTEGKINSKKISRPNENIHKNQPSQPNQPSQSNQPNQLNWNDIAEQLEKEVKKGKYGKGVIVKSEEGKESYSNITSFKIEKKPEKNYLKVKKTLESQEEVEKKPVSSLLKTEIENGSSKKENEFYVNTDAPGENIFQENKSDTPNEEDRVISLETPGNDDVENNLNSTDKSGEVGLVNSDNLNDIELGVNKTGVSDSKIPKNNNSLKSQNKKKVKSKKDSLPLFPLISFGFINSTRFAFKIFKFGWKHLKKILKDI